ncbi:MAG: lysostaphin resistance A-like protein [Flavobacteriales bacterium]
MLHGLLKGQGPARQLFALLLLHLMGKFVFSALGLILITAFTDFDLIANADRIGRLEEYPGLTGPYRFLLFLTHFGQFILPALLFPFLIGERLQSFFRFKWLDEKRILFTLLALFLFFPVSNYLTQLNAGMELPEWLGGLEETIKGLEERSRSVAKELLATDSTPHLVGNILLMAALPAIGEELIFRGTLQRMLNRWSGNIHLAIWGTAFLFAALHLQFYSFLPRFALGALFGYMLVRTGTLWVPVLGHFLNNATVIIISYLGSQKSVPDDYGESGGQEGQGYWVLISFFLIMLLFYTAKRWFETDPVEEERG